MALVDDLITARDNIGVKLRELTENFKPSYNIDGQEIRWQEYFTALTESLKKLNEQIDREQGPLEERTKAYT